MTLGIRPEFGASSMPRGWHSHHGHLVEEFARAAGMSSVIAHGPLTIPAATRTQPTEFTSEDQRWVLACRMLHDSASASIADRVAASLVLLYAQPVARIAALTRSHIDTAPDNTVYL
ncbi:MAG: hypothetical protein GEU86_12435 [Actinophytocola sp.]|nr:hypothetical protein [Actinophytocola sp.]